eukprot:576998-Rhodomonas_salina.1
MCLSGICPHRFDLCSVDIARARDSGLPRFSDLHSCFGLGEVSSSFNQTFGPENSAKLAQLYASPQDVDPLVGMLAQQRHHADSTGARFLPPLLSTVIGDQFWRLHDGDSFFYLRQPASERSQIANLTMAEVIKRNSNVACLPPDMPVLASKRAACFGGGSMQASAALEFTRSLPLLPGMHMSWSIFDGKTLSMLVMAKTTGFMAVGLGAHKMVDVDVIYMSVAEDGVKCQEGKLEHRSTPKQLFADTIVPGSLGGFEANGTTGVSFQRELATGDPDAYVILPSGEVKIIFAVGASDTLSYPASSREGPRPSTLGQGQGRWKAMARLCSTCAVSMEW